MSPADPSDLVSDCVQTLRLLQGRPTVRVVAAVETDVGTFKACNVSVGECSHCSTCAEPAAIGAALAAGATRFSRIVAVGWSRGEPVVLTPCGGCRELIQAIGIREVWVPTPDGVRPVAAEFLLPQVINP